MKSRCVVDVVNCPTMHEEWNPFAQQLNIETIMLSGLMSDLTYFSLTGSVFHIVMAFLFLNMVGNNSF